MKLITKIIFPEPQIEFVMRALPNSNLDRLTEVCFEFDRAGKLIDCIGTIKGGGSIDHDYTGTGLVRLYETARRRWATRQTSATILKFPNVNRFACVSLSSCEVIKNNIRFSGDRSQHVP
jgi:hypothetical protein